MFEGPFLVFDLPIIGKKAFCDVMNDLFFGDSGYRPGSVEVLNPTPSLSEFLVEIEFYGEDLYSGLFDQVPEFVEADGNPICVKGGLQFALVVGLVLVVVDGESESKSGPSYRFDQAKKVFEFSLCSDNMMNVVRHDVSR